MINLLVKKEIDGITKYAITSYAIVGKDMGKLRETLKNLSFIDNPTSLTILGEVYGKPIGFNYNIGNMFYANNILLTHFFDKYRLRSASNFIDITDQKIIESFNKSLSDDVSFFKLTSQMNDFVTFSESILPYIDFILKSTTIWMPENLISRVGVAYNDAKTNADLLNLAMEISKKKEIINSSINHR